MFQARCQIVENLMMSERNNLTAEQIQEIASFTDGYSGADMKNLCQEASLGPIRSISFCQIEQISPDQVCVFVQQISLKLIFLTLGSTNMA